jgi:hypothetical protein
MAELGELSSTRLAGPDYERQAAKLGLWSGHRIAFGGQFADIGLKPKHPTMQQEVPRV